MQLDQRLGESQTDPEPAAVTVKRELRLKEWLKEVGQRRGVHSSARVPHVEDRPVLLLADLDGDPST